MSFYLYILQTTSSSNELCACFFSLILHIIHVYTIFQGVGYPLDIVVCSALGADMYDCVYPTRTARFGTALVPEVRGSTLKYVWSQLVE